MTRHARLCLVTMAAGIVLTTGSAAGAAKNPLALVLQRSDMPAKAQYVNGGMPTIVKGLAGIGIASDAAYHHSNIKRSPTRTDMVSGLVIVLKSPGDAQKTYRLFKDDLALKPGGIVRLPAYGDDQVAWWVPSVGKAGMLVRKGAMVWQLEVDPDPGTKPQTIAQLQSYAVKQKRRIGSG